MKTIVILLILASPIVRAQTLVGYCAEYNRIDRTGSFTTHRYEVHNLFYKSDSGWVRANENNMVSPVYPVFHCKAGKVFVVRKTIDSFNIMPDGTSYFRKISGTLPKQYHRKQFLWNEAGIMKATIVANQKPFAKKRRFKNYDLVGEEYKILFAKSKEYVYEQFEQRACKDYKLWDSARQYFMNTDTLIIQSGNALINNEGTKLLTFLLPFSSPLESIYPFSNICYRSEIGNNGFEITCAISCNGEIAFLGEGLKFIDHADFDGDGMDDYIFWYSRQNHEGFVLFSNNFNQKVVHGWNYH